MNKARDKEIFTRKLKGNPIGHDAFGRPILEGDLLLFAAKQGTDSELRVIKVVETMKDESYWAKDNAVKFRIRRAERVRYGANKGVWELQDTKSIITRLDETFLLDDPPQFILDLFVGIDDA
jgi:hypothetical protein